MGAFDGFEAGEHADLVVTAGIFVVRTDDDLKTAAEFLKDIAAEIKRINAEWEPRVKQAFNLHKKLKADQKAALKPYEDVDAYLRGQVSQYATAKEAKRREAEAELRRKQEEERKKLEALAAQKAEAGDLVGAMNIMADAEALPVASVQASTPKIEGVSYVTEYDVEIVDDAAVPVEFNGAILRPVDMSAVRALVKAHKGNISIPGIKITSRQASRVRS